MCFTYDTMFYMQREVKKTKSTVKPGPKSVNSVSAKVSKQENSVTFENNPVAIVRKTTRKLKAETPVQISVSIPKAKKSISAEALKKEKISAPKKKTAAVEEIAKQSSSKLSVKVSAPTSKTKKSTTVNLTVQPKKEKSISKITVEKLKSKEKPILTKTDKPKVKIAARQIKPRSAKIAKAAEKKAESVALPIVSKPVKKKIKPIGSAVVRGKSGKYDFEVFPLDAELKDGSAIYVISKRITDKLGRGHHKFVCIGQTESLLGDLKKHKKDKCIRQHKANVVCLLREENETNRLKIETDLRQAHTIVCNQK